MRGTAMATSLLIARFERTYRVNCSSYSDVIAARVMQRGRTMFIYEHQHGIRRRAEDQTHLHTKVGRVVACEANRHRHAAQTRR